MALVKGKSQLIKYLVPNEQLGINTKNGIYTFGTTDAEGVSAVAFNGIVPDAFFLKYFTLLFHQIN